MYKIPDLPFSFELETKEILKQLAASHRRLAELKGVAQTIPNENILINTLTLQEAKDSSEVENIVTTHDEIYKTELSARDIIASAAAKEVLNYREAMKTGFGLVREAMMVQRKTASKYLKMLIDAELMTKVKIWKNTYYINTPSCGTFYELA